jgi:hypothetical protein
MLQFKSLKKRRARILNLLRQLNSLMAKKRMRKRPKSQKPRSLMERESSESRTSSTTSFSSVKISRRLSPSLSGPIPITSPYLFL